MSSTAPERAQQEPSTTTTQDEAPPARLIPTKREYDEDSEVQFISSHPIKKMRLGGDETGPGGQTAETPAACPNSDSGQVQTQPVSTIPDRSTSAMPLGPPSHLPPLANRGVSLPVMGDFSFEMAHTGSLARPPASVAVSPRQIPQPTASDTIQVAQSYAAQRLSSKDMSLDHITGSGALESGFYASADPATNKDNSSYMNTTSDIGLSKNMDVGATPTGPSSMTHTMSNFTITDSLPLANMTPSFGQSQYGTALPKTQAPMASTMPWMSNHVSTPQQLQGTPLNAATLPGIAPNPDRPSRQPPQGEAARVGTFPTSSTWSWSSPDLHLPPLQHPRPLRPPHVSGLLSGPGPGSPLPTQQQQRPCLACDVARQYGMEPGCHTPAQGQVHRAPSQGSQPSHLPETTSWAGGFSSQTQGVHSQHFGAAGQSMVRNTQRCAGASSFLPPAYGCPSMTTNQAASNNRQAGIMPALGQGPFTMPGATSATGQNHFGAGTDRNTTQYAFNPLIPSPLSILASPRNAHTHGYSHSRHGFPAPPSTSMQCPQQASTASFNAPNTTRQAALNKPQQQQQPQPQGSIQSQHHHQPPTQFQPQPQPPLRAASAADISAAATRAATHASTRPKHAQNLLVDVAELVAEIFPFDIVARQHGTLPRKVSEALAAVVQVPLLRCATDKRRAGKLGSDRMKEFREARKGWLALVREWEREERERERKGEEEDAEGEEDDTVFVAGETGVMRVGWGQQGTGGSGGIKGSTTTKGKGGKQQANADPRAVYPPGEPSALDVALLLPPAEMPGQMLGEGFFSGPW